jgi:hypothetical protein
VRFCCAQNINLLILQVQENNIGIYHTAGESTPTMLVLSIPVNQTKEATTTAAAAAAAAAMVWCGVVWCGVVWCENLLCTPCKMLLVKVALRQNGQLLALTNH